MKHKKMYVRSLMRWVKKYKLDGEIKRTNRQPIAYKIRNSHVQFILSELNKNKTITMEDLLIKLKHKFPELTLSQIYLSRIIRDSGISLKLTRLRHEPNKRFGKDIDINDSIKKFYYAEKSPKNTRKRNAIHQLRLSP